MSEHSNSVQHANTAASCTSHWEPKKPDALARMEAWLAGDVRREIVLRHGRLDESPGIRIVMTGHWRYRVDETASEYDSLAATIHAALDRWEEHEP